MSNQDQPSGLDDLFAEDEVMLRLDHNLDPKTLREMDGIAFMTDVAAIMGLAEHYFRLFATEEERKGVDIYAKYGIRKDVGKWKINLQRFFRKWSIIKKSMKPKKTLPKYKRIPVNITRPAFFNLKGVYKINHVLNPKLNGGRGFLPLTTGEIKALLKKNQLGRKTCGVWQEGRLFYCQFEIFLPWLLSIWRRISLEEAQKLVDNLRK